MHSKRILSKHLGLFLVVLMTSLPSCEKDVVGKLVGNYSGTIEHERQTTSSDTVRSYYSGVAISISRGAVENSIDISFRFNSDSQFTYSSVRTDGSIINDQHRGSRNDMMDNRFNGLVEQDSLNLEILYTSPAFRYSYYRHVIRAVKQ